MAKLYCVYVKSDYEPLIRPYVFTEEAPYRRFIAGAEEDGTYWGRRLMTSLPTEHVNAYGKVQPAELCKDIAAYLNMLPFTVYVWDSLSDFIYEYGEEADDCYLGRDEYGEKQYITHNPNTEWHGRITRELRAIGYYARYDAWAKEQKAA